MGHPVDGLVSGAEDDGQSGATASEQLRLGLGAVVRRRVGAHDVADTEGAQPAHVGAGPEPPVQDRVARKVGLPVPAAHQRDAGFREIGRRPVSDRVDGLDAVVRRQMTVQERDHGRPVGRRRGHVALSAGETLGQRGHIPRDGQGESRQHEPDGPPAAERREQERDRRRGVAEALDVRSQLRGHRERDHAGEEVDDEDPPDRAGPLDAAREDDAVAAEQPDGSEVDQVKRVPPGAGKEPPQHQLREPGEGHDQDRDGDPGTAPSFDPDPEQEDDEQEEGQRARGQRQHREGREAEAVAGLQRPERQECEGRTQREGERGRKNDAGPDDGKRARRQPRRGPPLPAEHHREGERGSGDRRDREHLDPDQGRERVVEQAVGDERVPAGVPEVVPEHEAVLEEDRTLIDVGGEVRAGRSEPENDRGQRRSRGRREKRFPYERRRANHERRGYPPKHGPSLARR